MRLLSAVLLAATLAPAPAASPPGLAPFVARYEVLRNGALAGRAEVSLREIAEGRYELRTHTRGTKGLAALAGADVLERSEFEWREGRPSLLRYEFVQKLAFKGRRRRLEATGTRIDADDDGERVTLPRPSGVIDRHLVVLALGADLARDAPALVYIVADRDEVETQRYRVLGRAAMATPLGRVDATEVERVREDTRRSTRTWLARDLRGYPLRVLQRERDGTTIEMRLVGVERGPRA